jgi:hypothetical protein
MSATNLKAITVMIVTCVLALGSYSFEWLVYKPYVDQSTVNSLGGYWSDLYPPWYASRELLLRDRNPYSDDVTREIQTGFTGKPNSDPKANKNAFVYPVFVIVPLSPSILMNFGLVRRIYVIVACLAIVFSVSIWARAVQFNLSRSAFLVFTIGTLSSFPVLAALVVQQLALFVLPLLGFAFWCAGKQKFWLSGLLLAFSTFKPQLSILPALLLLLWAASRSDRRSLLLSFSLTVLGLWAIGEFFLHGWVLTWVRVLRDYASYTAPTILQMMVGRRGAALAATLLVAAFTVLALRVRHEDLRSESFLIALSFSLALEMLVTPNGPKSLYNHFMLLPAVMVLWKMRARYAHQPSKFFYGFGTVWLVAPWLVALVVAIKAIFAGRPWQPTFAPFNIALFFPLAVLVLIAVQVPNVAVRAASTPNFKGT